MDYQAPSLAATFLATLKRDLLLAFRRRSDFMNPLVFFLMVCSLFPLGIGPDPKQLAVLAPGILWVVALLACLLSSDTLFRSDYDDGSLELMLISPVSLYIQVTAKTVAHWLLTGFPLTLLSPVLGLLLQLPFTGMAALMMAMAMGTASLSFIGAIGAGLTVGLRKGGLLLSLIILPLYIPVLIFGVSSVKAAVDGFDYMGQLAILGAFLALAVTLAPLAIAASVRISADN
ncbi:heme exporter protein CcmB [Oceanicoccus sagamiensis]|uniref:Heme exporter protein B n=1 Tax=Oceanicoccus sagamiensis TaxID=716816 RepID=A0A1X9NGB8_9GAMM|nr:heme exporter protein CcmB [Oceanicoccus sagamiensis]ARN75442.1 heme exporter protein CcmB [Oceanicoccus sagamiensis]